MLVKKRNANLGTLMEAKAIYFWKSYCYGPSARNKEKGKKASESPEKREDQYVKAYRRQMKKADHDYYPNVHTSHFEVDGKAMGPFETKYESMQKSLLIFTEMGAPSMTVLLVLLIYIAEHVSPRIAGRWDGQ